MFELDLNDLENSLKKAKGVMDIQKAKLISKIDHLLDDSLDKKTTLEICSASKFLVALGDDEIKILEKTESPDFLIERNGKQIGLEVRELKTKRIETINFIQNLFKKAEKVFKESVPDKKILVNFWLNEPFMFKTDERSEIAGKIALYIQSKIQNNFSAKPDFIKEIDIQSHTDTSFFYNEGGYGQIPLDNEIILGAIEDKESKINNYMENSKTEFQWLLLVNSEVGSDSFDTFEFEGIEEVETEFEHIYLLKDFDCQIIQIK